MTAAGEINPALRATIDLFIPTMPRRSALLRDVIGENVEVSLTHVSDYTQDDKIPVQYARFYIYVDGGRKWSRNISAVDISFLTRRGLSAAFDRWIEQFGAGVHPDGELVCYDGCFFG